MDNAEPPPVEQQFCAACSKPIRPDTLALFQHGAWFHVRCRSRVIQLRSVEEVDRATRVRQRALSLVEEAGRRQTARRLELGPTGACPFCAHPATLTDWRPRNEWIAVEGCPCSGFFVWVPLLAGRIRRLPARDRQDVADRIRTFRARGDEAWLGTTDGTITGPLVVRSRRPDRLTGPPTPA